MKLAPQDNVAVALRPLRAGEDGHARRRVDRRSTATSRSGTRSRRCAIAAGATITKYNCPIGIATHAIAPGEYVHTHNVKSGYLPTYSLP